MEQNDDDDHIPAVSSLRARFENFNTNSTNSTNSANISKPADSLAVPHKPPSRPVSPAPKPDKLRDLKPGHERSPSIPVTPTTPTAPPKPTKPKPVIAPSPARQKEAESTPPQPQPQPEPQSQAHPPPPPLSTKPTLAAKPQIPSKPQSSTPAVTVQPPQSPPRARATPSVDEHPALLNPDAVVSPTAQSSPKPIKSPSRPTTPSPALPPPRSPRGSAPPSPPPPRRSGEIRREAKTVPPPPAPRRDKTNAAASLVVQTDVQPKPSDVSDETSPFNSPPASPDSEHEESPPQLPARPRPQNIPEPSSRPRSAMAGFEPPPVHHSIATKRQGNSEINGHVPHGNGEFRPGSVPKQPTLDRPPRPLSAQHTPNAPPRPPRPNVNIPSQKSPNSEPMSAHATGKRTSSTPISQQLPLPPTRTHGRSKTADRPPDRPPVETRPPQTQIVPAPQQQQQHPTTTVAAAAKPGAPNVVAAYPDCSSTNRRPPYVKTGAPEITTKYDPRSFDVCGELVCTSGQLTRVWDMMDGEMLTSLAHTEGIKATSVAFKPGSRPEDEGFSVWVGTNSGELMEVDLTTHAITPAKANAHQRREVIRMFRHFNELWTLDSLGTLLVWGPDQDGVPNLTGHPHQSYKMPREHSFSMVVGDELWHATGKEIRAFAPTLDGRKQFQVLIRPLHADGAGDVTSGTIVKTQPGKVFFGHSDGKISIFSTADYCCLAVLSVSTWKINCMAGVGHRMWIGYNNGKICVFDMTDQPWSILKEWSAHGHGNPVFGIKGDSGSSYRNDRLQVVSLGADNKIKIWDGLLEDDWIEDEMKSRDTEYCDFEELKTMIFTWNAGASTPSSLRYSGNDGTFFPEMLQSSGSPDILVFGFQELVDLEDKAATAKRFLKGKKSGSQGTDQQNMSHQYRDWKNYLMKTLDDYMPPDDLYQLLYTAPLVGLFTCVFVKASLRDRIKGLSGAEVKRGMGGVYGNKGAVAVRFKVDDSSICFVNCHLAAGQTQAAARHNDIAEILEASLFPSEYDPALRIDNFAGGGDGTMVVDHELCVLNGDLNYRIDTMSRDTVVTAVKQNNLPKLLDRDQLLVARRRNPAFRLRAFEEMPITFPPTYKYDVGTDRYDTSEKRRSPAWCDRILFRGRGRVQQMDYRRHEVYVSDHRPVTGNFSFWVKKIRPKERTRAWMESQQAFETVRLRETADEKLHYLMNICGYDEATSKRLVKEKASRRLQRSPERG